MNSFDAAALRLKQQLKVTEDKQAAVMLGLTSKAWGARKRRESFPITEVFALAQQQPELGLDPDWIVTGSSPRMEAANNSEASLLRAYRLLPAEVQRDLTRLLITLAGPSYHEPDDAA